MAAGEYCQPNVFQSLRQQLCRFETWRLRQYKNVGSTVFITGDDDLNGNEKCDFFTFRFERAGGAFADRSMSDGSLASIQSIMSSIKNSNAEFVFAAFKNLPKENRSKGGKFPWRSYADQCAQSGIAEAKSDFRFWGDGTLGFTRRRGI